VRLTSKEALIFWGVPQGKSDGVKHNYAAFTLDQRNPTGSAGRDVLLVTLASDFAEEADQQPAAKHQSQSPRFRRSRRYQVPINFVGAGGAA